MDVTDCRDLTSLQAILFMIMFLQASAKLSTCYSHIGIALRSAVRMGLHRSVAVQVNPIDREIRKRVFWVIRNMDIYVGKSGNALSFQPLILTGSYFERKGAILGLPMMLSDDDIDQELPLDVDDDCITETEVKSVQPGRTSLMTAVNAHTRLVRILAKTVKYIYPLHGVHTSPSQTSVVSHAKIREIEQDMQRWMEDLPTALRPGSEVPAELLRYEKCSTAAIHTLTDRICVGPSSFYASPMRTSKFCFTVHSCTTLHEQSRQSRPVDDLMLVPQRA